MFENLKIKKELKERFEVIYDKRDESIYIKDIWNNVSFEGNTMSEIEDFLEHLIKIYVENSDWLVDKYKYGIIDIEDEVKIMYRDMIIDYVPLRTGFPSVFNEKKFKKDCYDIIKIAKELKKEVKKKINKNKIKE